MTTARARLHATLLGLAIVAGGSGLADQALAQQIQTVAPARELNGLNVSLVLSGGRRFGDGYRLFDRSDGDGGGAGEVTKDLLARGGSGQLAVGLGIQGESYKSSSGGLVAGTMETTGLYGIAGYRFRAAATWQPYLGLAAGIERGSLLVNPGSEQMKSEALGVFGRASVGLRFAPRRLTVRTQLGNPIFAVALGVEVAGTVGTPLRFEYQAQPVSQGAGDSDRIPTSTVSLGNVSRLGVHGRGLVTVTF